MQMLSAKSTVFRLLPSLLAICLTVCLTASTEGLAQTGTSPQPQGPVAGATPGGTDSGLTADANYWREVRDGAAGIVAAQNRMSGRLIQSDGHYWERTRNGPLLMYAAWLLLGTIMLLALFFALRGRVKIEAGFSGRMLRRFSFIETTAHWVLASSFLLLALTGLNLLFGRRYVLPHIGHETFAIMTAWGKHIHNYVGFAFMVALAIVFVTWVWHNLPHPRDVIWILRGGGLFGGGHVPAKKFNAGQKLVFWAVTLCGLSLSLSGLALLNPFGTAMFSHTFELSNAWFGTDFATPLAPVQEQQYQQMWHTGMGVLLTAVILGHIYIGTIGMQGALEAMTTGNVDLNWAREHHSLWVEDIEQHAKTAARAHPAE